MKRVFSQTQLYRFLYYCEITNDIGKNILDCGAGGSCPPLALFQDFGYITHGVEISNSQIEKAQKFFHENSIDIDIVKGDIRFLPHKDESMSFAYSYNTIFHMSKADIRKAVDEIKRVLVPGGLCFINFLSLEDGDYGKGEQAGEGEFFQDEDSEKVMHTYHTEAEANKLFSDMKILYKENRVLHRIFESSTIKQGYIDYIAQKQ